MTFLISPANTLSTGRLPSPPKQYTIPKNSFPSPPRSPELQTGLSSSQQDPRLGTYLGDNQSLQLQKVLGSGAYGVVYYAEDRFTGTPYAVKALNKYTADGFPLDARQVEFQRREIRLHHMASNHPNVVPILKILDHVDCTFVILEYCPEGDLFSNITERGQYVGKDAEARQIFLQILDAVEHCHRLGIYHRDLKPENILVTAHGRQVKLADFGLAIPDERTGDFGCGSTFYMSPECQNQAPQYADYACAPNDIWSLGVILVNLTCGRNPWKKASHEDSTFRAFMKNPDFLQTILPISTELNMILKRIFELNPLKRISIQELKFQMFNCHHLTTTNDLPTPPPTPARRHNRRQEVQSAKPVIFFPQPTSPESIASFNSDDDYGSETESLPSLASESSCEDAIEFEDLDEPEQIFTPNQGINGTTYFEHQPWVHVQQAPMPQVGQYIPYQTGPPTPPLEEHQVYFQPPTNFDWSQQQPYVSQPQPKMTQQSYFNQWTGFLQPLQQYSNCRQARPQRCW